jgi:type I restriction enzyme, S subunit
MDKMMNSLPNNWQHKKLGDVCKLKNGYAFKSTEYINNNEAVPIIRISDINDGIVLTDKAVRITSNDEYKSSIINNGDILIAMSGATTGKFGIFKSNEKAYQNQRVGRFQIIDSTKLDNQFLYYQINALKRQIEKDAYGGAQPNISSTKIEEMNIVLPPLPQQQQIVAKIETLFTQIDAALQTLQTLQQQNKLYRQTILQQAFEGKLVNVGEMKWVKLGDVVSNVEYGSAAKSKEQGKVPVLRMGNIQNGLFDWQDLVYTNDDDEIKRYSLKKNDVLFNRTNSPEWVGKTAIYKGERPAIFAGYLIRINRKEDTVDAYYLNYYLNSPYAKNYGDTVKSFGVNQSNINGTKLKGYPFPITSIQNQQLIVQAIEKHLSVADNLQTTIAQSIAQAKALKQSILQKAFSGQLLG